MKTRYYIGNEDDANCAVYLVEGEHLAHVIPDWEWIEESESRKWTTASKSEARAVAARFKGYGATVRSYTVTGVSK